MDASEVRYRHVVEMSPDIIWINRGDRIAFMNQAGLRLFGATSADQILGRTVIELFHPDSRSLVRQRIGQLRSSPHTRLPFIELRIIRLDGEVRDVEATAASFHDQGEIAILSMLRDITERKRAQAALIESHRDLRALAAALESIREEERKRVSRDLHDELGQLLSALAMDVAVLKRSAPSGGELQALAEEMESRVDTIVAAVRRIAKDLRPLVLDTMGLVPALRVLASEISERQGLRCQLHSDLEELALPDQVATQIFRIVQEALSNVVKHACANTALVSIERSERKLVVRVEDDGRGMAAEDRGRGCGLIGMRERARTLGGELAVASTPGAGTIVELKLPIPEKHGDGG
jgi:PAS domain S-box-containing protein